MSAPARYVTAPTPGAAHETDSVAIMARALGWDLMPWQLQVARIATERRADGRGWRWPTVILTVPRQSGKTVLMHSVAMQRTLRYPGMLAMYTAQSGKDARERWAELVEAADGHIPGLYTVKRGAGAETIQWNNGRGRVRTFAPTKTAIHGSHPELVMLDEAFAYDEDLGAALMASTVPAQITRPEQQIWIVSTAGDLESTWFRRQIDRGREACLDPLSAVAYAEWSADDDVDVIADPTAFEAFHPAVGYTQTIDSLRNAREQMADNLPGYARAFSNRWPSASIHAVISEDLVTAAANPDQTPPVDLTTAVAAYDVAPDRTWAAIWIAWTDAQGTHLRPYLSKRGAWWLADAAADLVTRGVRVAADDGGAARSISAALALRDVPVETLGARDFAAATGDLLEAITNRTVDHDGGAGLIDGLAGARLRRMGDLTAWARRDSTGPIWEVVAATVALRVHTYTATVPAPLVVSA